MLVRLHCAVAYQVIHNNVAQWLDAWASKLFGATLAVNGKVFASERATGDRTDQLLST